MIKTNHLGILTPFLLKSSLLKHSISNLNLLSLRSPQNLVNRSKLPFNSFFTSLFSSFRSIYYNADFVNAFICWLVMLSSLLEHTRSFCTGHSILFECWVLWSINYANLHQHINATLFSVYCVRVRYIGTQSYFFKGLNVIKKCNAYPIIDSTF